MTEFLVFFSPETRHASANFSTVNLRTTMLNRVGVLIDHFGGSYAVTGRQESLFGPTSRSWVARNPWRLRFKVVLAASASGTDF